MTLEKKKNRTQTAAIAVFLIVAIANYARLPHEGIRSVDFIQILAIGMLTGVLLIRGVQILKRN
jgi:hypothetical protein